MKDVNKILLIGRLGNDPVQRETKAGMAVTHFSLATSRKLPETANGAGSSGEAGGARDKEETQWHRVVVWGKQAEACKQYLSKGQPVFVEGSIRSRKYTNKDGTARIAFEVHADSVSFLGRKRPTTDGMEPMSAEAPVVELAASA